MKTILFQGDSITDCSWDRKDPRSLGNGYPYLVAAKLGLEFPSEYTFYNRGISGNRIVDLYARIKADIINLKPDYLSILIGVNDVLHEIAYQNGVDTEKFEKIYTMLLEEIREALPQTKILLMAPFVLNGSATANTDDKPGRWQTFRTEVDKRIEVVDRLGDRFKLPVLHLQERFDECVSKNQSNSYWLRDGVHPTASGHEMIAREWLRAFHML